MAATASLFKQFVALLDVVPAAEVRDFLALVDEEVRHRRDEEDQPPQLLQDIVDDLKATLPSATAEAPNENIIYNHQGDFAEYTKDNTVSVDGFLYTEDDVDELCDSGKLPRNVCNQCKSTDCTPLNFISHSMSPVQLEYLFAHALPSASTSGKTIVDVGSRLGAVLYGAYEYTKAAKIVGIEFSKYFVDVQQQIVSKYNLGDRIELVCNDVRQCKPILSTANVIILNNVFQFFAMSIVHKAIWQAIISSLQAGTILVTVPALHDQLLQAKVPIDVVGEGKLVEITPSLDALPPRFGAAHEELAVFHIYRVTKTLSSQ